MPETNLHKRIEELESENHILRAENKLLRDALGLPIEEDIIQKQDIIIENENAERKVLFRSSKMTLPKPKKRY